MARPIKEGFSFFPLDVDIFEDEKIQFVSARFGLKGEAIAIRLLCKIFRQGYFIKFDEDATLLFARAVGDVNSHGLLKDVVNELLKRGFFERSIFERFGILTSKGIQKRYLKICKDSNRINSEINPNFDLIKRENYVKSEETPVKSEETAIKSEETPVKSDFSTQSKEKKSKENESKENEKKGEGIDGRKLKFSATLKPFLKIYGRDFLNDFYRYWTEPNKSNTKFKQELERTWDLKRRLDMWARNDKNFKKTDNGKFNNTGPNPNSGYKPATVDREKLIQELTDDLANGNIPGQY